MDIKIRGKEVELKYSFNSFNYMESFDISQLDELENKPFMIIPMTRIMLLGAVNNNTKERFSIGDVNVYLESIVESDESDICITDLFEVLVDELQKSNFFKSLQKKKKSK